jgi:undecaprenyl-diphosphatase
VDTVIVLVGKYLIFLVALMAVVFTLHSERATRNNIVKLAVVAIPMALIIGWVAGRLYYHPRPFVVEDVRPLIPHEADNGFPSDHTLLAMTASAVMFVYRRRVGFVMGIMALLIGAARVVANIHYPVDVAAGASIALASTGIAWIAVRKLLRWLS